MKNLNISKFFRKDLTDFTYWPLLPNFLETMEYKKGFLKLDTGENIIEMPLNIMRKLTNLKVNYYPGVSEELINIIANKENVSKDAIFLGNGTKDSIDLINRLFIDPGDEVIVFPPTYPLYGYFTQLSRGKTVEIMRNNMTEIKVSSIKKAITNKTKLLFIDNPSNPFGYVCPQSTLRSILDLGIIVVIDEAYYEFCGETAVPLLKDYPNLIILRTFSKVMGLAGMRFGYSLSSKDIKEALVKIKIPNQVNIAAQFLAKEVIKNIDIKKRALQLISGREYMIKEFKRFKYLQVFPSRGAYVVIKIISSKVTSENLYKLFYDNKILLKKMDFPDMEDSFLRFNVVPINVAKKIINVLKKYEI